LKKPTVGQMLFSLNVGNAARNRDQVLTPVTVTKVGRKYFYAATHRGREIKYELGTWVESTNYCANSILYLTKQAWLDVKEKNELTQKIKEYFGPYGGSHKLTLIKLQQIDEIILNDESRVKANFGTS